MRPEEEELWNQMVLPWKASRPPQIYHPVGCLDCRMTGYAGRIGIYEVMLMSPELKKLIRPDTNVARLRDQAYREGMRALRISGASKVAAGITTLDEVMKVAPPAEQQDA
jgi:general secretion pathway protein E